MGPQLEPITVAGVAIKISVKHLCGHNYYQNYRLAVHVLFIYRMAGNIGGEFNLAVWQMSGRSAK